MTARDPDGALQPAPSPRTVPVPLPALLPAGAPPLPDLAAWARWFSALDMPVLADTADGLEEMRANEDAVDANQIGELVGADPLMTLKVLRHAAAHRSSRVVTDTETVTAAVVMMGISPFFRAFGPQATVEAKLRGNAPALHGMAQLLQRARRAANFALAFAVRRMDSHAAAIHQAALLHDFAEMLLWCHAPALAHRLQQWQQADPALRSSVAQREWLNIELPELQHALMLAWHLPPLLVHISDEHHAEHHAERAARACVIDEHSVQSVQLAVRLARHTRRGWHDAALPDDLHDIGRLLNLTQTGTLALLHDVDR